MKEQGCARVLLVIAVICMLLALGVGARDTRKIQRYAMADYPAVR